MGNSSSIDSQRQARAELEALRREIRTAADLDGARRERALREIDALEDLLSGSRDAQSDPGGSGERIQKLALEFEASHPQAAELVGRLANLLASMGI
jgi:hypothetical protein